MLGSSESLCLAVSSFDGDEEEGCWRGGATQDLEPEQGMLKASKGIGTGGGVSYMGSSSFSQTLYYICPITPSITSRTAAADRHSSKAWRSTCPC